MSNAEPALWLATARRGSPRRRPSSRASCRESSITRLSSVIEAHLEFGIDVGELAAMAGLSISHFFRKFKELYGVPPHRYLLTRRLMLAQKLLVETDLTLVDIAFKAGFADQSHLSRRFQRFTGLGPGAYRVQQRWGQQIEPACQSPQPRI
jgi:transcriptional regulator GlxA family with amidase domain